MKLLIKTDGLEIAIESGGTTANANASERKHTVDTFVPGLGTVRDCIGCGCLIAGGPTRCIRCAEEAPQ